MGHSYCEDIQNYSLRNTIFYKFPAGHTAVLSTVFSLPFCVCVQANGNSQWRDLNSEPAGVDKTVDCLFALTKSLI